MEIRTFMERKQEETRVKTLDERRKEGMIAEGKS